MVRVRLRRRGLGAVDAWEKALPHIIGIGIAAWWHHGDDILVGNNSVVNGFVGAFLHELNVVLVKLFCKRRVSELGARKTVAISQVDQVV